MKTTLNAILLLTVFWGAPFSATAQTLPYMAPMSDDGIFDVPEIEEPEIAIPGGDCLTSLADLFSDIGDAVTGPSSPYVDEGVLWFEFEEIAEIDGIRVRPRIGLDSAGNCSAGLKISF